MKTQAGLRACMREGAVQKQYLSSTVCGAETRFFGAEAGSWVLTQGRTCVRECTRKLAKENASVLCRCRNTRSLVPIWNAL